MSDPRTIRLSIDIPRSRWQAFKWRHQRARWLSWYVRIQPVRTRRQPIFAGVAVPWPDE